MVVIVGVGPMVVMERVATHHAPHTHNVVHIHTTLRHTMTPKPMKTLQPIKWWHQRRLITRVRQPSLGGGLVASRSLHMELCWDGFSSLNLPMSSFISITTNRKILIKHSLKYFIKRLEHKINI